MTSRHRALFTNDGLMFLLGVASVMIGTTLPEMIDVFGLSLSQGGLIVSAQSAGGFLAMFFGMIFADRVRKPAWIVGSVVVSGVGFSVVGVAPGYWFLVSTFFVMGLAVQVLDMLLNAFTGDIAPESRSRQLNILHMLYGVGAFIGPVLARWLLDLSLDWRAVYWIAGGLYLGAGATVLVWFRSYTSFAARPAGTDHPPGHRSGVGRSPGRGAGWGRVGLLGGVMLFYAVHQMGTTAWLPHYMASALGVGPGLASAALSLYWVGIIVSRLIASVYGKRAGEVRILVWGTLSGGVLLIGVVLAASPVVALVGFALAGVVTGATLPVGMALAYGQVSARTGTTTAVVYGLMMTGRLLSPWLIGKVGDERGIEVGIMIAAIALLGASIFAVVASKVGCQPAAGPVAQTAR